MEDVESWEKEYVPFVRKHGLILLCYFEFKLSDRRIIISEHVNIRICIFCNILLNLKYEWKDYV